MVEILRRYHGFPVDSSFEIMTSCGLKLSIKLGSAPTWPTVGFELRNQPYTYIHTYPKSVYRASCSCMDQDDTSKRP
jgi:hypothetical protein